MSNDCQLSLEDSLTAEERIIYQCITTNTLPTIIAQIECLIERLGRKPIFEHQFHVTEVLYELFILLPKFKAQIASMIALYEIHVKARGQAKPTTSTIQAYIDRVKGGESYKQL